MFRAQVAAYERAIALNMKLTGQFKDIIDRSGEQSRMRCVAVLLMELLVIIVTHGYVVLFRAIFDFMKREM